MILKYLVEVKRNAVSVYFEHELVDVHYWAKIDGIDYAYQIIANSMSFNKPCDDWFKRGGMHVHYHANNQGHNVQWLKVTNEFIHRAMKRTSEAEIEQWSYQRQWLKK